MGTTTWSCLMTWRPLRGSWREQQQPFVTRGKLTSCAETEKKGLMTPVPSVWKMVKKKTNKKNTEWLLECLSAVFCLFVYFLDWFSALNTYLLSVSMLHTIWLWITLEVKDYCPSTLRELRQTLVCLAAKSRQRFYTVPFSGGSWDVLQGTAKSFCLSFI